MPQAALPRVAPASPFRSLPYEVEHTSSRTGALLLMALLLPVLAMVVLPLALVLAFASHDLWEVTTHKPLPVAIFSAGLLAWVGLLLVSTKRVLQHFGNRRRVRVDADRVHVTDSGLFGNRQWSAPLAEFAG